MLKRFFLLFLSIATGLLASAAILVLAQHPAGVAWAAPAPKPLTAVITVGGPCGLTIQACVDAAAAGDQVHIPAGRYSESVTVAKSISLTGDLSSTTIIHALDNQRVMTITGGASVYLADVMLTGGVFTSTGLDYSTNCGGGLKIDGAGPAVLHHVAIISNTAYCGGGLGAYGGAVTLDGVDILSNTAGVGGGASFRYILLDLNGGSIRNNIGTYLAGGMEQEYGDVTMGGGEVMSNSTDYFGGGVVVFGKGAVFTQTGGSIFGNSAKLAGGGLDVDAGAARLAGGEVLSNSSAAGAGIALFSEVGAPASIVLEGGRVARNTAIGVGGGVYLANSMTFLTQTAGSVEQNVAVSGGGLFLDSGSAAWLVGGQVISNTAGQGGGVAVGGPDSWFTQSGGQIAANTTTGIGGGMFIGYSGSVTVSIAGGLILSNSAVAGSGAIAIDRGTLVITGSRILSNTGGSGPGALAQFYSGAPVSVTVGNSCIASNGPLTSVVNSSGSTIDARGNWWGTADGPGGAGPGSGDSVSSGVEFSSFLTAPPVAGCPAPTQDLTVGRGGNGTGSVTSTPAGIDCGATCSAAFFQDSVVTLTATPAVSSTFAGWTGACSGVGACIVTITQTTAVTATFSLKSHSLAVGLAGNGGGNVTSLPGGINCGATCAANFNYGTVVSLTAQPAASSSFAGWQGGCAGLGPCVVTLTSPSAVTATFSLNSYTVTVALSGTGSGLVTGLPAGIHCGAAYAASFAHGTALTLTAVPTAGSSFVGWSGACGGTGSCGLTIKQAVTVTATFDITLPYRTYLPLAISGVAPLGAPIKQRLLGVVTRKWGQ